MEKKFGGSTGRAEHALCVVGEDGIVAREGLAPHDEEGIAALCRELARLGVWSRPRC